MVDEQRPPNIVRPEGYVEPTPAPVSLDTLRSQVSQLLAQIETEEARRRAEEENRPQQEIAHDLFMSISHLLGNPPVLEKLLLQHKFSLSK